MRPRSPFDYLNPSGAIALGLHLPHPDDESLVEALARVPERLAELEIAASVLRTAGRGRPLDFGELMHLHDLFAGLRTLTDHYGRVALAVHALRRGPEDDEDGMPFAPAIRGQTARALRSWRLSEGELERVEPELALAYEAAVRAGSEAPAGCASMGDLVRHYFSFGWRAWVVDACGGLPDGRPLWHGIVREAAFWRRARELVTAAVDAGGSGGADVDGGGTGD